MRAIVAACVLMLSGSGCENRVTGPDAIRGTTWRLESLQRADGSVVAPPAATFTLRFVEDGRLEVRADCNGCGAAYTLEGEVLDVGLLACTRAFCPSAPFDTEYAQLVEASTTVSREGETLVLRSPRGRLRFVR